MVPAPPAVGLAVARTSASISPSPFAPPPASAPIAGPVSQSLPLPSSPHLTAKAKSPDVVGVHSDRPALSSDLNADDHPAGSEYVMEHTSASTSRPDHDEAGPGGNLTAGNLDAFTHDPPDQPQSPSRQVCLSPRAIILSACVYTYVSCDRVKSYRLWILRHHAPHTRRRPLCSFLPRLRVSDPLNPRPTLFLQKNPTHQTSYPSIRRRRRRHRRCVDHVAVTYGSSPNPTSKDGN